MWKDEELLSTRQEKYNSDQQALRAICEWLFGDMKTKIEAQAASAQFDYQQEYLFAIVCGVHNYELL